MSLIDSWKKSLQLLKPSSLKHLVMDTVSILLRVYVNFDKWAFLIIGLMVIEMIAFFYFSQIAGMRYVLLLIISILSAFTVLMTYSIVKDAVNNNPISLKRYKLHLIIGTGLLSLIFAVIYFYTLAGVIELFEGIPELRKRTIAAFIKKGLPIPSYSYASIKMNIEYIVAVLSLIFVFISAFIGSAAFIYLYFLDSVPSVSSFFKSIFNGLKFLLWNLPGLIVIYGVIVIVTIPFGYVLRDVNILINFIVLLVSIPLVAAINGELYKRLKV